MKILIATHKPYQIPEVAGYQPIMVGSALRDEVQQGIYVMIKVRIFQS